MWQGGQVVYRHFIKQNVAGSRFPLVMYNNCTIKNYFWFRYIWVTGNLTKVVIFKVVLSGIE